MSLNRLFQMTQSQPPEPLITPKEDGVVFSIGEQIQDAIARQRASGTDEPVSFSLNSTSGMPATATLTPTVTSFRFYVGKKGEKRLAFDGLPIVPNAKTMTSRDFKAAYEKQLHDTLFTTEEEVNFASMISLISVYDHAVSMRGKVPISSGKYIYRLGVICSVLSVFFTRHRDIISSIATMVNNRVERPV